MQRMSPRELAGDINTVEEATVPVAPLKRLKEIVGQHGVQPGRLSGGSFYPGGNKTKKPSDAVERPCISIRRREAGRYRIKFLMPLRNSRGTSQPLSVAIVGKH